MVPSSQDNKWKQGVTFGLDSYKKPWPYREGHWRVLLMLLSLQRTGISYPAPPQLRIRFLLPFYWGNMSSCNWGAVEKLMDRSHGGRKDSTSKGEHGRATEGTALPAVGWVAGLGGAASIAKEGMCRQWGWGTGRQRGGHNHPVTWGKESPAAAWRALGIDCWQGICSLMDLNCLVFPSPAQKNQDTRSYTTFETWDAAFLPASVLPANAACSPVLL